MQLADQRPAAEDEKSQQRRTQADKWALNHAAAKQHLMRAVPREVKASGRITEPVRDWLAGEDSEPDALPGSVTDARDRRDRALLGMVFPKGLGHGREVARVLGEPERSTTAERRTSPSGCAHFWPPSPRVTGPAEMESPEGVRIGPGSYKRFLQVPSAADLAAAK
ncbi:hypothetical protein [Streptomyces sp. NPDC048106]|uniref:hypothetical protein n=1 Tax=Streptomyces sp. NPDC048106 TaxID=3155750 RepID=UPI003452C282